MSNIKIFSFIWKRFLKRALSLIKEGIRKCILYLIYFYQACFSIHFGGACRFSPTCSEYARQVFSQRLLPPDRAIILVIKRILKCGFFGPFGIDERPWVQKGVEREWKKGIVCAKNKGEN